MLEDNLLIKMSTTIDGKKVGVKVAITKEMCSTKNIKEVIKFNAEEMYEAILKYKAEKKRIVEKEGL
jgi:CRISPR/Cas system CMR-associated protein Cmr1 (group 7 of RAMP superfamily)